MQGKEERGRVQRASQRHGVHVVGERQPRPRRLLLAVGVDVFGCRHTPSGAFDLIAEDFNYALLLLLLAGLAVGALLLRTAAKRKNLDIQWT